MTQNNKIKNSLTAAALATLITLGGGHAAVANTYTPSPDNGGNTSQTSEVRKSSSDKSDNRISHKKVDDRHAKRQFNKSKAAKKNYSAEMKLALAELKAERDLINSTFKNAVKKAVATFKEVAENPESTEEQVLEAEIIKKEAIKVARLEKATAITELRIKAKEFAATFKTTTPKL